MSGAAAHAVLAEYWDSVRIRLPHLPEEAPAAWAFGATPEHADELLDLVLRGIKTGTASSGGDYEHDAEPLPVEGDLNIILDGAGRPRAVIETTQVTTVPFDRVTAEHARAEGEGDRTLAAWRDVHERFWRTFSDRGFAPQMPVVCERFRLLHPIADDLEV